MDANGTEVENKLEQTHDGGSLLVRLERKSHDEQFNAGAPNGSSQKTYTLEEVAANSAGKLHAGLSDEVDEQGTSVSSAVHNNILDDQSEACSTPEGGSQRKQLQQHASVLEISHSRGTSVIPSPQAWRGLEQHVTEPVGSPRSLFLESHQIAYSKSMTEKKGSPMYDLKLNRMSKSVKVNTASNMLPDGGNS